MKNQRITGINTLYLTGLIFFLTGCVSESPAPGVHTVEIRQMQFQPSELRVQPGDTVVFINRDMVVHDVAEETGKSWSSPPLQVGQSYRLVVSQSTGYYCTIHPVMKGRLLIQ